MINAGSAPNIFFILFSMKNNIIFKSCVCVCGMCYSTEFLTSFDIGDGDAIMEAIIASEMNCEIPSDEDYSNNEHSMIASAPIVDGKFNLV